MRKWKLGRFSGRHTIQSFIFMSNLHSTAFRCVHCASGGRALPYGTRPTAVTYMYVFGIFAIGSVIGVHSYSPSCGSHAQCVLPSAMPATRPSCHSMSCTCDATAAFSAGSSILPRNDKDWMDRLATASIDGSLRLRLRLVSTHLYICWPFMAIERKLEFCAFATQICTSRGSFPAVNVWMDG